MINEKVVKNTVWNSVGFIGYFACQWLVSIVVVRLSGDYTNAGNLALAMNISNILFVLGAYNNRYFQVSDIKGEYNDSEYLVSRILTCAAAVLICVVFVFIEDFSSNQRAIILCYMVFRANEAFVDVLYGYEQKNWRMDYIGISMILRGVAMLAAFALLIWLYNLLTAVIGVTVLTFLILFLFDFQKAKKLVQFTSYTIKKVFSLLKRCFPLMLVLLISTIIVSYARYLIERIHGTEALGIYTAAINPTMLIQVSASLMFAPLINLLAESLKEFNKKKFLKIFLITFTAITGITVIFTAGSYILGEWILNILFGETIIPYAYLMTGASVAAGLTSLMWFMNVVFSAVRDIKGIFACNLIGMIICFTVSEKFLTVYGIEGANYVMMISQGVAVFCVLVRLFWVLKRKSGLFTGEL